MYALIVLLSIVQISSCTTPLLISPKVLIYNRSTQEMAVFLNFDYPDTSIRGAKFISKRVPISELAGSAPSRYSWIKSLEKSQKVTIYFMPNSLLDNYGEKEAKRRFKPSEKLVLSLEDLKSSGWKIFYPYELNKTFKAVSHP